jgi:DsbC/DsbD-like thiol-disulfide interchange protein
MSSPCEIIRADELALTERLGRSSTRIHEAYVRNREGLPRHRVDWRVIDGNAYWRAPGIVGIAAMLAWFGRRNECAPRSRW